MQTATTNHASKTHTILALSTFTLLLGAASLNGGALVASSWDGLVTTVQDMLGSTMILSFAMVALLVSVWQIFHGRGYGALSLVLGVLAVAILGPAIVTGISSSVPDAAALITHAASMPVTAGN